jgi:hypothetical protein
VSTATEKTIKVEPPFLMRFTVERIDAGHDEEFDDSTITAK